MDLDNVLGNMSAYDFSEPLKTVIVLEDNEDTDTEDEVNDLYQNTNNMKGEGRQGKVREETNITDSKEITSNVLKNASTDKLSLNQVTPDVKEKKNDKQNNPNKSGMQNALEKKRSHEDQNDQSCKKKCYSPEETNSNKQDEKDLKISNYYLKSTFKILSDNLLHIVAAKVKIYNVLIPTTINDKDTLDKQFTAVKYSFFKMTYCVTVTMLLPLENNPIFIKKLLLSILQYGHSNGIHSSHDELMSIYSEMLLWTKEYRRQCVPPINMKSTTGQHEVFTEYTPSTVPQTNTTTAISPQMIDKPLQVNSQPQYLSTPSDSRMCQNYNINVQHQKLTENRNSPKTFFPNMAPAYSLQRANSNQIKQHQVNRLNQSVSKPYLQMHAVYQTGTSAVPRNDVHYRSNLNKNKTAPPPYYYTHINLNRSYTCNSVSTSDIPPPNITITNRQHFKNDQSCQMPTDQIQGQQYDTKSLSRDSGFVSPLLNSKESMNDPIEQISSLIVEVTSLNPDVQQMDIASCIVCRKPTRKVCLGCYKEYYCSFECMQSHWPLHQLYCTNTK